MSHHSHGSWSSLVHLDSNTYVLAFQSSNNKSGISTFTISPDGQTITELDFMQHDVSNSGYNSLVKVDSDTVALAYRSSGSGTIKTFDIDSDGDITLADSLKHTTSGGFYNSLVQVDSDTFALAYVDCVWCIGGIYIATVDIDSDGDITAVKTKSKISNMSYQYTGEGYNSLVQVDSDTFALAYTGAWYDGYISTLTISSDGQTITKVDTLEHDEINGKWNSLVQVDSDTFALAYQGNSEGYISTFDIDSDGDITAVKTRSEGNNLKYGDAPLALESWGKSFVKMDSDTFALAHTDPYSGGHITTFNILSDGQTITKLSALQHDTDYATRGTMLKVGSDTVAIAYYGSGGEDRGGIISTVTIGTAADDRISVNKNINTSLSESVSLTDDTAAGISVTQSLSETIGLADSISKTKEIVIPLGETLQVSDSVSIGKTVTQSLTETISLEDKVSKAVEEKLSESVSLTDSSSAFKSRIVSLSESISFTDSSGKEIVTNLSESIALTEGITKKVTVDLSESVQLIDSRPPSAPTDIVAVDAETDGVNGFDALNGATDVDTFTIGAKTYAIVTGKFDSGVQIIDISDPTNIVALDEEFDASAWNWKMPGAHGVHTFTIGAKTYAIVTAPSGNYGTDGIQMIDVSDPTDIVATDSVTEQTWMDFIELQTHIMLRHLLLVQSTYAIVPAYGGNGVQMIDVSDPTNIVALDDEYNNNNGFDSTYREQLTLLSLLLVQVRMR